MSLGVFSLIFAPCTYDTTDRWIRFRFLAKTDGDTFPCLSRATEQLLEIREEQQPRVYAGMLNK